MWPLLVASVAVTCHLLRQANGDGMAKRIWILVGVVTSVFAAATSSGAEQQPLERHVVPLKTFARLPTDKRFETVSGNPSIAGAPFVVRIHAEPGYVIMPHTHQVDENIVVLKGSWALGMGTHFDRSALEPMELGDYGFAPKNMVHFALSKTATTIQVHGLGPFATTWLIPMYELSEKGVLLKTAAGDPGRFVPSSPKECFVLKLGDRVRSEHGEGVIAGAQCTPGQLTQYRVEKADGEMFWAQSNDLNSLTGFNQPKTIVSPQTAASGK
jgi:hypothetical protein